MHIGLIQSCFAVKNRCIITSEARRRGRQMSLANATVPDAASPRLTALPIEQAAALLRRSGSQRTSAEAIRADIATGAPVNADGTLNLIAYGAWLVQELANREASHGG
jgi:hypothetical protein